MEYSEIRTRELKGNWVGPSDWRVDCQPVFHHPIAFRKDIELASVPDAAILRITASDKYAIWVNGKTIAYGPARSWPEHKYYDELDITGFCQQGKNQIAVLILPPTGSTTFAIKSRMGLFIQGIVQIQAEISEFYTDHTWQTSIANWISSKGMFISIPTDHQEHHCRGLSPKDWLINTPKDGWQDSFCFGSVGTPPWKKMILRPVPLLDEQMIVPSLVWKGKGSTEVHDLSKNLAALFNAETIIGQPTSNVWGGELLENESENIFVFDFGRTRRIRPGVEIAELSGNIRVEFYYDLKIEERPTAFLGFGSDIEGFCDSFEPSDANDTWEAITGRGFRFMVVKIAGAGQCQFRPVCKSIDYQFPDNAEFECDEMFWMQAWSISKLNLRSSTNDVIVDTCSRENLLWVPDACISGKAAFYSFGETAMWRHCLSLAGMGIDKDGIPYSVVPAGDSFFSGMFCVAVHWINSCYEYYMLTGDIGLLREVAYAIERFLRLCEQNITEENFFVPPSYAWHWIDWAYLDRRPYSLAMNAMILLGAKTGTQIANVVKNNTLADISDRIGKRLQNSTMQFFDKEVGAFCSWIKPGIEIPMVHSWNHTLDSDLEKIASHSLHANTIACLAGCGSEENRISAMRYASMFLNEPLGPRNQFTPGMVDFLLRPLLQYGHSNEVISFIKRVYGAFLDAGAPTWGELFDGLKFNTAHGWGASVNSLFVENIVGLKPAEHGWRRISFQPLEKCELKCRYSLRTPAGLVTVEIGDEYPRASWPQNIVLNYRGREYIGTGDMQHL